MSKVLKVVSALATIASFIPGVGTAIGLSVKALQLVAAGAALGSSVLDAVSRGKAKAPSSPENANRLRANIDVRTPRKTAVGSTALATDIRDEEITGNQEFMHRFIVVASHKVAGINEIWFDDKMVWSAAGGIATDYLPWLGVECYTEGSAANAKYISSRMGYSRRYTGLAYVYLRYKINDSKSPFAQSITSRITIRGDGAYFYDPRRDSTVAGGSGSHRAADQSTWAWDASACRNPALALLFYLLGWRINGELAVGKGIPANRIDLASFAVAANICDEMVSTPTGTEPRYRCDGVWSEGDSPTTVIDMLKACMNADLDDVDGKLRLTIFTDTTFASDADFTDDDIMGKFAWNPQKPLESSFNVVRGTYTDPSNSSLYQQVDYPEVRGSSPDGIDRIDTFNLPMVQSPTQAQRLAELRRNRQKFGGVFKAEFQATAWRVQKNSIVRLTFSRRGWVNKTFRVAEIDLRVDGVVPLTLVEEDPAIYVAPAFKPAVVAASSMPYDPFKDAIQLGVTEALALAQARGKVWTTPTIPSVSDSNPGDTWVAPDGTLYDRVNDGGILLGGFAITLGGYRPQLAWTRSANQPVVAAATTATWSNITGNGKPEDSADVTSQITGPAAIVIDADYTGAVISSLPKTEAYQFLRNGADLTSSSTAWSVTVLRGVISASIGAATGVLSLNLNGGALSDAMLRITATNAGKSRSFDVAVTKLIGSPPATGAGGSAASSTFSASVSSSTMVAVSPELNITVGSGGTANLTASYDFETGVSGAYGLVGRWYRWNGSAFVAIGIEVNSSSNARFFPVDGISEPGSGQVNFTDTGLTPGSSQRYQLYARGADATTRSAWGNVAAVGG